MILIEEIKNRTFIGNSCFCDILNSVFSLPPFVSCCSHLVENIPKCFCYKILGRTETFRFVLWIAREEYRHETFTNN